MTYATKGAGLLVGLIVFSGFAFSAQASQPVVNAGPDQNINYGQMVTLAGSASDPAGGAVTYSWFCTAGSLSNTTIAQPIYTAPNTSGSPALATCTLTVRDINGISNYDSATIYIGFQQQGFGNFSVQTSDYSYSNGQTMLYGYLSGGNTHDSYYVWFQWGETTSYGNDSFHQLLGGSASFSQLTFAPTQNQTYHFRAVGQSVSSNQIMYGQDITFCTGNCGTTYMGTTIIPYNLLYFPQPSVLGAATYVPTGLLDNNLLTDSFFLPLVLIIAGGYLYYLRKKVS